MKGTGETTRIWSSPALTAVSCYALLVATKMPFTCSLQLVNQSRWRAWKQWQMSKPPSRPHYNHRSIRKTCLKETNERKTYLNRRREKNKSQILHHRNMHRPGLHHPLHHTLLRRINQIVFSIQSSH